MDTETVTTQELTCQTERFSRLLVLAAKLNPEAGESSENHARIHRKEQRYLVQDIQPLRQLLLEHGAPYEHVPGRPETETSTIYLDLPGGTWSVGKSSVKFRCRSYQDPDLWWFEIKRRAEGTVTKWRQPVATPDLLGIFCGNARWPELDKVTRHQPLVPLVAVRYWRMAFQWPGLRLTVDRNVSFYAVDKETPHQLGEQLGGVDSYIVEVKPDRDVPAWLAGELANYPESELSKSKRALAARGGLSWNS